MKKSLFSSLWLIRAGSSALHSLHLSYVKPQPLNCHWEFPLLKLQAILFSAAFQCIKFVVCFKLTPRYNTNMFHSTRLNLLLGAAVSFFRRWKHLWCTQGNVRLPAEPRCALKLPREELPFHLHCWRATKHFSTPLPPQKTPAHPSCRHGTGHDQGDALQATWTKPSRIFTPHFQWTTDWALKTFLAGQGIQDGHPTSSQQTKNSAQKQLCLADLDMNAWSRGKIKTCGCLPWEASSKQKGTLC